jgi:hypothetical protein
MQLFDVDCHGNPPRGNRGNGGRMGNSIGTLAISSSAGTESSRFQRTIPGKPPAEAGQTRAYAARTSDRKRLT